MHATSDTPQLLTADESGVFKLWDIRNFACIQTFEIDNESDAHLKRINSKVQQLAVPLLTSFTSLPKHRCVVAAGRSVHKFTVVQEAIIDTTDEHPVLAVHYNTIDSIFTTVSPKSVCMWHAHTGALLTILPYNSSSSISTSAVVQQDGSSSGSGSSSTDSTSAQSNNSNGGEITAASADRCGRQLILGDQSGAVRMLDCASSSYVKRFDKPCSRSSTSKQQHMQNATTRSSLTTAAQCNNIKKDVVSVIFVPEYRLVITATANTVWVCDDAIADSGTVLRCITNAAPVDSSITTMAYSCTIVQQQHANYKYLPHDVTHTGACMQHTEPDTAEVVVQLAVNAALQAHITCLPTDSQELVVCMCNSVQLLGVSAQALSVYGNVSMLIPMTVTAVACSIEAPPICSSTATCSTDQQQELSATQSYANITNIDSSNNSSSISSSMTSADDNKFVGCLESTFERYWGAKGALHDRQLLAHSVTGIEWHDPSVAYLLYSGDEGGNLTVTDLKPLLLKLPVYYNDAALRPLQSAIVVANPRRVEQRDATAAVAYSRSSSYTNSSYTDSGHSETEGLPEGLPVLTSLYTWRAHTDSVLTVTLVQHPPALATSGLDRLVRIWSPQGGPLGTLRQSQKTSVSNTSTIATAASTTVTTPAGTATATGAAAGMTSEQHSSNSMLHNSSISNGTSSPKAVAKSAGGRGSSSADVSSDVITPWLFRPDRSELRASRAIAAAAVMKQLALAESAENAASGTTDSTSISIATKVTLSSGISCDLRCAKAQHNTAQAGVPA
eukprot:7376-Heterococcus_DN1.PRE.4